MPRSGSRVRVPFFAQSFLNYWLATATAKIAQLVEHNLAKVGVAGPSPVFRSIIFVLNQDRFKFRAQVAELVDAHVSGACVSQRAGSSPVLGTYV